jgi:ATP-dependent helicase/nuclease subunit A
VLFRLDGGIDHILVDEAQDTSPAQWDIVNRLAEDFAAGRGRARRWQRTIFVVGDKKQSIYSFQGADPEGFDRMRDHFDERLRGIGQPLQATRELTLFLPLRPTDPRACGYRLRSRTPTGSGARWNTRPFSPSVPGAWTSGPSCRARRKGEDLAWYDPQDLLGEDHHYAVLAKALATACTPCSTRSGR